MLDLIIKVPCAIIADIATGCGMANGSNIDGHTYTTRVIKDKINELNRKKAMRETKELLELLKKVKEI